MNLPNRAPNAFNEWNNYFLLFHIDGLNIPLIAKVIPMRVLSTEEIGSYLTNRDNSTTYPSSDTSSVRIEMSGT